VAGLGIGLKRKEAIRLSFLLSIPVILGAFIFKIPDLLNVSISRYDLSVLSTSFLFSYLAGFLAIKYFLKFSEKYPLNVFAYYRFILSILVLAYFFTR
jgi:undecaprenyl-diphosphatase